MKSALAVLLVLAAASAVSAAQPALFKDWLSAQNSGKARPAYYGSEAETVHACLRTLAFENCQTFDACGESCTASMGYFETKLGCCHPHGYGYDDHPRETFKAAEAAHIGSCWWNVNYFDVFPEQRAALPTTGSVVVGTFDVTCELKEEAEKCDEIFCDDMVLKGWGQIHEAYKVAVEGKPTAQIPPTETCTLLAFPGHDAGRKAAKAPTTKASAAQDGEKAAVQNEYYHPEVQYFEATATVYSGYVNTYSCNHNLKVKEGHFQAVLQYTAGEEPIVPSPGQFILRPYTIDMKLKKAGEY